MKQQLLMLLLVVAIACNTSQQQDVLTETPVNTASSAPHTTTTTNSTAKPTDTKTTAATSTNTKTNHSNNTSAKTTPAKRLVTIIEPTPTIVTTKEATTVLIPEQKAFLSTDALRASFNNVVKEEVYPLKVEGMNEITTTNGSIISINTKNLETEAGKEVTGPVTLKVMEMRNSFDMLAMHAPTVSDGKMLESGGSWYITASSNGENLRMKPNTAFNLSTPNIVDNGYTVFYGNNTTDGVNWKPTDLSFVNKKVNTQSAYMKIMNASTSTGRDVSTFIESRDNFYSDKFNGKEIKSWIDYQNKRVLCSEIWEFNKRGVTKTMVDSKGNILSDASKEYSYDALTERQKDNIVAMIEESEVNDRCKILNNVNKQPITYQLLHQYKKKVKQIVIDSVVTTANCKDFPEEVRRILMNKMQSFCRTAYFRSFVDQLAGMQNEENERMLATITQLGWINCDRFYNNTAPRIYCKTTIKKSPDKNFKVYLAFKNINSLLVGYDDGKGNYGFSGIPEGEPVMAIALGSDGATSYFGKSEYVVSDKNKPIDFSIAALSNDALVQELGLLKQR